MSVNQRRSQGRGHGVVGLVVALALSGCTGGSLATDVLPSHAEAEATEGLGWVGRSGMNALLRLSAWRGSRSGYVAMFARDGEVVYATAAGVADIDTEEPMNLDTRFRIASMTKPVTAVAAHILIEEGALSLDDPVSRYLPAAGAIRVATSHEVDASGTIPTTTARGEMTVRHLLQFSSGIGSGDEAGSALDRLWEADGFYVGEGSLAERVDRVLALPLYEEPGTAWRYGYSADVLARVVEIAANESFGDFVTRRIIVPLGMKQTEFLMTVEEPESLAKVYTQDAGGELVRATDGWIDHSDFTPGGSGLVSTVGDYMRFALMLWHGGTYQGRRILAPETVARMTSIHVPEGVLASEGIEGLGWGLGLAVVRDADATPMMDADGDYWWSGYFGTTFFVSPSTGLVGVVMSQNEPGPHSDLPLALYLAQAFAFIGL